jgi:hypothetical protein
MSSLCFLILDTIMDSMEVRDLLWLSARCRETAVHNSITVRIMNCIGFSFLNTRILYGSSFCANSYVHRFLWQTLWHGLIAGLRTHFQSQNRLTPSGLYNAYLN